VLKFNEFLSRKGNAPNCEAWFGLTARGEFNLICDQHSLDFMKVGLGHRSPIPPSRDSTTHGPGVPGFWPSEPLHSVRAVNNLGLIQQIEDPATFHAPHFLFAY
jgi:hypothetical protein